MNKLFLTIGIALVAVLVSTASEAQAQHGILGNRTPIYSGTDAAGMTMSTYDKRVRLPRTLKMASHGNPFTPNRLYTYSNAGVRAQRTHGWNQQEAMNHSWNGEYSNWRFREPTALVVPPTAGYQTSYAWGVGQTRSAPIHHQFGNDGGGMTGGGGGFMQTPYAPSSTDQFGLYPVRAPW